MKLLINIASAILTLALFTWIGFMIYVAYFAPNKEYTVAIEFYNSPADTVIIKSIIPPTMKYSCIEEYPKGNGLNSPKVVYCDVKTIKILNQK